MQRAFWYAAGMAFGWLRRRRRHPLQALEGLVTGRGGISVVIPSRNGRSLLAAQLPGVARDLSPFAGEIIVVDNGSGDGTAEWLAEAWPGVRCDVSPEPLSFARAVNRGIAAATCEYLCLLNNDMLIEPGFFQALLMAFRSVPDLFCATAQIRFPEGVRREETGKAVMAQTHPEDFPIRCDEPVPGEDLTWVLYGSGGCSLYDAARLRELGGADEAYAPAYVEDLDLGYRAWQRGWPTVFVAGAMAEHRHRATTLRYYSEAELARILEINYLRFLVRAVADRPLFRRLWKQALGRLRMRGDDVLRHAARIARDGGPSGRTAYAEESFLALTGGDVAVFPGRKEGAEPLVEFVDRLAAPPAELLDRFREVVLVRKGNEAAFREALRQTGRKQDKNGRSGTALAAADPPES